MKTQTLLGAMLPSSLLTRCGGSDSSSKIPASPFAGAEAGLRHSLLGIAADR